MGGLFAKDFRLLMQRKGILILYLLLGIACSLAMEGAFVVAYLTVIGEMLAVGTISYDEHDNGFCYLMTLPVDAKTYAVQKHLFSAAVMVIFWVYGVAVQIVCDLLRGNSVQFLEAAAVYAVFIPVFLILYSVVVPLNLKFGVEKSRVIVIAVYATFVLAAFGGMMALKSMGIDVEQWMESADFSLFFLIAGVVLIAAAVFAVCTVWSVRIMRRKEY